MYLLSRTATTKAVSLSPCSEQEFIVQACNDYAYILNDFGTRGKEISLDEFADMVSKHVGLGTFAEGEEDTQPRQRVDISAIYWAGVAGWTITYTGNRIRIQRPSPLTMRTLHLRNPYSGEMTPPDPYDVD